MRLVFYGSSLLSSYWNGAATYYRGLLRAFAALGHEVTFCEPDAFDRQAHRDIDPPDWARVIVWPATGEGLREALDHARGADVVVKASGVGVFDDELLEGVLAVADPGAVRVYWDVDAPATLADMRTRPDNPLHRLLPHFDVVFTYGGGNPVARAFRQFGARASISIYNALDPETHHPVPSDPRFTADLAFLGNRLPDREARVKAFFTDVAEVLPTRRFLIGGAGWEGHPFPPNVTVVGHVGTRDHNAFNVTPMAVLNIARDSMAETGFSPATRVFEAAGAGACLITDAWAGIDMFLEPGRDILVAESGEDVARHLVSLDRERARAIGAAARERVLAEHTYAHRARQAEHILSDLLSKHAPGGRERRRA